MSSRRPKEVERSNNDPFDFKGFKFPQASPQLPPFSRVLSRPLVSRLHISTWHRRDMPPTHGGDAELPLALVTGVPMLKISSKKIKQVIVRLVDGAITWHSRKGSKVFISQIRELRLGQPPTETYSAKRWISIVYVRAGQWKVFHMVALTDDIYDLWIDNLKSLVSATADRQVSDITPSDPDMLWIKQLWPYGAEVIQPSKANAMCKQIGLFIPSETLANYRDGLDIHAFRQLILAVQSRSDVDALHRHLAGGGALDRLTVEAFLLDVQKLSPEKIFDQYRRGDEWTKESLLEFLTSSDNRSNRPQVMTRPLSDYFISSSHNTYLVGEQWRGESTVEGYIRILLENCRSVEIDCHDGDPEPVVYHKKTLTSKAPLRDICRAINKYAFVTSPYPIIISAEVHCTSEQQDRLAAIVQEVFGDRLVTHPLDASSRLPSPEQLRYRILLKAKPPVEAQVPLLEAPPDSPSSITSSTESETGFVRMARRLSISSNERPPFSPTLTALLVYTKGVKYQGFSKLIDYQSKHQFSVSERTANKILKENKADWVKHNFDHISRVYPRGASRLLSTNYDPVPYWAAGCQLVAMNWQTLDAGALLNHAMFADTPGYLLKPIALRQKIQEMEHEYRIRVKIISAQRLPLASDLFVEANIGSSACKTATIKGIALNPMWDESLEFMITATPSMLDLTFVRLEIRSRTLLAQWIRTLAEAPRGYHHLPLYDSLFSKYVFATLFVRIDIDVMDQDEEEADAQSGDYKI